MPKLSKISGKSEITHLFINLFIHLYKHSYIFNNKQILTTYNIPGTVIGVGDATVKKAQDLWSFGGNSLIRKILKISWKLVIVAMEK